MYEAYYGMKEKPFALMPDPAFLYMSRKHGMALSMLEYSLTGQAGFSVVTGEVGSGKTTLIRQFLRLVDRGITVGVIANTHPSFGDLLQWVLQAFNVRSDAKDKASRYQAFVEYLVSQNKAGKRTILIVDEAQNLRIETLEELRLLSNVNSDKDQLLQMVLVGQPELLEKLKQPELRQFAQRISVHYHLQPLAFEETRNYIRHRLQLAGADPQLFDELAIGAIHHFTTGVPRLINSVCDMALVYGYANSLRRIDIDTILGVVEDKEQGTLLVLPKSRTEISREQLIQRTLHMLGALNEKQEVERGKEQAPTPEPEPLVLAMDQEVPAGVSGAEPTPANVAAPMEQSSKRRQRLQLKPNEALQDNRASEAVPLAPVEAAAEDSPRPRRRWVQWLYL